jgi:hypothetical protein
VSYARCIGRIAQAAGRQLSDDEVRRIFERIHKAALDIKAGRVSATDVTLGPKLAKATGVGTSQDPLIQQAAQRAAAELAHEAAVRERQAHLQVLKLGARQADVDAMVAAGVKPLDAVERSIVRDYSGRTNIESLEQRVTGHKAYFSRKLLDTWQALGDDFLGFWQDRTKLLNLVRELRGESTGDAVAAKGAKAFHEVAEEARQTFNAAGGDIGRLDDWGMPQHHSQEKVAGAGRDVWVNSVLPMLDRSRYVDDLGVRMSDAEVRAFLEKAWDTIATNGHANHTPGARGAGKRASQHGEHRQIHFKDAQSVIDYWDSFGERTAVEILHGHIDTMARDIAFIEHFGPNPNVTYQTMRDAALKAATKAEPVKTEDLEGRAVRLDSLYDYAAGRIKPSANTTVSGIADGIAHLNTAGKLGGAALASLFGDKPMMEAVSHLNDLPVMQRWGTELSLLSPTNAADRRLIQRQGLMLDSIRSGLQRLYEGLGQTGTTGKIANAVMRITGMQAINDIRKGAFGVSLMSAIGHELDAGRTWGRLSDSDVRTLRNYGITESDWKVWKLARLEKIAGADKVLTPEAISLIPDAALKAAHIIGQADGPEAAAAARRNATVKLLGAVNTESEFAIVTPGWKERAAFYSDLQRGTVKGEIARSVLQFKSFPWAMFHRMADAVANKDAPVSKAAMTAYLITSTTLAGAMLLQTREMLAGKDPRKMADEDWYKFWAASFLQGGALGIYGDFLYSVNQTRYGSGPIEALAGPTIGPLLELGLVQPLTAAKKAMEGKETHLGAQTIQDLKGFVPGGNIWYAKAALDHLIWQNVMESLSPGYLASIRQRTQREYGQQWWWEPGEATPDRGPALERAIGR